MNINRWIPLDPKALDSTHESKNKGVFLEVSLSPYDIPEGVRGYYCQTRKKFIIEFKYIADEPTNNRTITEHLTLREGKNSKRLYGFEIDAEALNIQTISLAIKSGFTDAVQSKLSNDVNRRHINERLIESLNSSILPELI